MTKQQKSINSSFGGRYSIGIFAAGVIAQCAFLFSLYYGFLDPLFMDSTHRKGQGADFYAVYQAGKNFSEGVSIYAKPTGQSIVPYSYAYRYTPFPAYTIGQIHHVLPARSAYVLWVLILEVLILLNLWLTRKLVADRRVRLASMSLWLLFMPLYPELYLGQFSLVMATLMFWAMYFWQKGSETAGGSLWTSSLLLKSNSALLLPVLIRERKWKSIAIAAVAASALTIPYFLSHPESLKLFTSNITESLSIETVTGNHGFVALLSTLIVRLTGRWLSDIQLIDDFFGMIPELNRSLELPILLWTMVVAGSALVITFRADRGRIIELCSLWIVVYFLVYKHVWEHHYIMLLPVFVFLSQEFFSAKHARSLGWMFWTSYVLVALPTLFVFLDTTIVVHDASSTRSMIIDPEFSWTVVQSFLFHCWKPIGALLLFIVIGRRLWPGGRKKK